jgi:hypothetical protein
MSSIKKLMSESGFMILIILLAIAFGIGYFGKYVNNKSSMGNEYMTSNTNGAIYSQPKAKNLKSSGVVPAEPEGQNEVYASVSGISSPSQNSPSSCSNSNIQNPADLLPKDSNSQWAQLNPSGKGELANINLLKAGYHIGIDTIGQTLRNANLQIRSEPPNPQLNVGPWNQSTITPDFIRPPLEIGSTTGNLN